MSERYLSRDIQHLVCRFSSIIQTAACVCVLPVLTTEEFAHRVSRFGQTPKQALLPVGVRQPDLLEL